MIVRLQHELLVGEKEPNLSQEHLPEQRPVAQAGFLVRCTHDVLKYTPTVDLG